MLDIIAAIFESIVSFLETLVSLIGFVVSNVNNLFSMFSYVPTIIRAPLIMALAICIVLGIKKAVLA